MNSLASRSTAVKLLLQLSPKRFVCVRTFKGRIMVDIREYWEDSDGDLKPGKKGTFITVFPYLLSVLCRHCSLNGPVGKAQRFCN